LTTGRGRPWHPKHRKLRLSKRAAEEVGLDFVTDVLDYASGSGDRDAVAAGDVKRRDGPGTVDAKPWPRLSTNSSSDGDMRRPRERSQELPKRRST
jgi:hypothetical protein